MGLGEGLRSDLWGWVVQGTRNSRREREREMASGGSRAAEGQCVQIKVSAEQADGRCEPSSARPGENYI